MCACVCVCICMCICVMLCAQVGLAVCLLGAHVCVDRSCTAMRECFIFKAVLYGDGNLFLLLRVGPNRTWDFHILHIRRI
jgi:hypothetical protein